jgi:hypothetical protein
MSSGAEFVCDPLSEDLAPRYVSVPAEPESPNLERLDPRLIFAQLNIGQRQYTPHAPKDPHPSNVDSRIGLRTIA